MYRGWLKDPFDSRDSLHKPKIDIGAVPNTVSLAAMLPDVFNQGSFNSCVPNSIAGNMEGILISQLKDYQTISRQEIWNGTRQIENTLKQNVGVNPRDAFQFVSDHGYLFESQWPYNTLALDTDTPSAARMALAVKPPDFSYTRVDNGVDGLVQCLADSYAALLAGGKPWLISLGAPWPDNKWDNPANGVLCEVSKEDFSEGSGHETLWYGYDLSTKYFFGRNSWGDNWGNAGNFMVPFSAIPVFKSLTGYDATYIQFSANNQVDPVQPVNIGRCRIALAHQEERERRGLNKK